MVTVKEMTDASQSRQKCLSVRNCLHKAAFSRYNEDAFMWLSEAMIVNICYNATEPTVGLYSRSDTDLWGNHMEIDFLIRKKRKICPAEVKPGAYRKHSSLDKFRTEFKGKIGQAYILCTKDILIKEDVAYLPLYMAMFL